MNSTLCFTLLSAAVVSLVSPLAHACSSSSAPGRLACNAAEAVAPASRRADDIAVKQATRASAQAAEQARVRASMEHLQTPTRPQTSTVQSAQDAVARAQRETAERSRQASAAKLQQLKAASKPTLPKNAKQRLGAAIHKTETTAAATAARQRTVQAQQKTMQLSKAKPVDNAALAKQQAASKAPKPVRGASSVARSTPGKATYDGKLPRVNDPNWLVGRNSRPLPGQVAERLAGREFRNFDHLRENVWREIGGDPVLSRSFGTTNRGIMMSGKSPFVVTAQQRGQRKRYELDHSHELRDGGAVYDLNNLRIKTPDAHTRKITRDFNVASGAH